MNGVVEKYLEKSRQEVSKEPSVEKLKDTSVNNMPDHMEKRKIPNKKPTDINLKVQNMSDMMKRNRDELRQLKAQVRSVSPIERTLALSPVTYGKNIFKSGGNTPNTSTIPKQQRRGKARNMVGSKIVKYSCF